MKLIKFSASWCMPCKVSKKYWDEFQVKNPDFMYEEYDIEENPAMISKYNIQAVPSIVLESDNGDILKTHVGGFNYNKLKEFVGGSV